MDVDHADDIASADQRYRKKGFIRIFDERGEFLEPRVGRGFRRERHGRFVLRHPPGHTLSEFDPDVTDLVRMGKLRGPQHNVTLRFGQVDQTCVASRDLHCQLDQLAQHLVQRQAGADYLAGLVQQVDLRSHLAHS